MRKAQTTFVFTPRYNPVSFTAALCLSSGYSAPVAENSGIWQPSPILAPVGWVYGRAMALRNFAYDHGLPRARQVTVPVISVGNMTTGGTGKSPMVRWLAGQLVAAGQTPGILLRGYGAIPGQPGDEEQEYRDTLPSSVRIVADPNRVAGANTLIQQGASVVLMDDGFQHRRLIRNLNIALVSAVQGLSGGRILPSGHLREPPAGLARADCVILTKCQAASVDRLALLTEEVQRLAPSATLLRCDMSAIIPARLDRRPVFLTCGIGQPGPFVAEIGQRCHLVGQKLWPDHHPYIAADWQAVCKAAAAAGAEAILTTRKDAVKIRPEWLESDKGLPLEAVSVEVVFAPGDGERLLGMVQSVSRPVSMPKK